MDPLAVFGGVALAAGVVILLFPKVFFFLLGAYMVINAATAFLQGANPLASIGLALLGILVFLAPRLLAWLFAFYLLLFCLLLFFWGFWILAIPGAVLALLVLLVPKIVPLFVGGVLAVIGGLTLLVGLVR